MTQKERLEQRFFELCDEIQEVLSELRRVNKAKGKNKKADAAYHQWLDKYLFAGDLRDLDGSLNRLAGYFKIGVRRTVDLIESDDMVRVVKFDVDRWEPYIDYLNSKHFEKSKDTYMECPHCHSWVKKNSPICICNHSFVDTDEVVYSSPTGYRKEKFIKEGSTLKHILSEREWVDGKLVEGKRVYVAEYKVVEGEEAQQLLKSMGNAMVDDAYEFNMPTTKLPLNSVFSIPNIYPTRQSYLYQLSAADFMANHKDTPNG